MLYLLSIYDIRKGVKCPRCVKLPREISRNSVWGTDIGSLLDLALGEGKSLKRKAGG